MARRSHLPSVVPGPWPRWGQRDPQEHALTGPRKCGRVAWVLLCPPSPPEWPAQPRSIESGPQKQPKRIGSPFATWALVPGLLPPRGWGLLLFFFLLKSNTVGVLAGPGPCRGLHSCFVCVFVALLASLGGAQGSRLEGGKPQPGRPELGDPLDTRSRPGARGRTRPEPSQRGSACPATALTTAGGMGGEPTGPGLFRPD